MNIASTSSDATEYEAVIGLEVHSQLMTESKMFCGCDSGYQNADPNTIVCEVCMGFPGVLPVINKKAVELVIATGLSLDCEITKQTKFDRKNYPYPDLMKGYQISQYDEPIAYAGKLDIDVGGVSKTVCITRVHLEEDVAKLLHRNDGVETYSLLDINRAGVPLMEIVSEPDMRSPEEARVYLNGLRSILKFIGVSTANMEEGSFRCDANVSVRRRGANKLGSKVEVKNMNSFRSVYSALEFEIKRQTEMIVKGSRIEQETRGWDEDSGVTVSQRSKEYAADYRYFPEPDLPPLSIDPEWVSSVRSQIPELPSARKTRFLVEYGLTDKEADALLFSKGTADLLDSVVNGSKVSDKDIPTRAKATSNWISGELTRLLNNEALAIEDKFIDPAYIIDIIDMVDAGKLNTTTARAVFEEMYLSGCSPEEIVEKSDLSQISDSNTVEIVVDDVISNNRKPVADYLDGKETAMGFLVGQVMKTTKGKANPRLTSDLIRKKLQAMKP